MIYGSLGLLLGALVTSELPGFFLIIMISLIDAFPQSGSESPLANTPILSTFPTYGPMQVAMSGGFGYGVPGTALLLALEWIAVFALRALAIFCSERELREATVGQWLRRTESRSP